MLAEEISFIIVTGGQRPDQLAWVIRSINEECKMPHEIIVVGEGTAPEGATFIEWNGNSRELPKKHNLGAEQAKYNTLAFAWDDIFLAPGWAEVAVSVERPWQVAGMKVLTLDGGRVWDWSQHFSRRQPHQNICYSKYIPWVYLGGIILIKKDIWEKEKWNEELQHEQAIDVEYCFRLQDKGYSITCFPELITYHIAPYHHPGVFGDHEPGCLCFNNPKYTAMKMRFGK